MSTTLDRDKFRRLMMMTTSENDGEALNALRLANHMLVAAGKTWLDVVPAGNSGGGGGGAVFNRSTGRGAGRASFDSQFGERMRARQRAADVKVSGEDVERVLKSLNGRRLDSNALMYVASISVFYQQKGWITRGQLDALRDVEKRTVPKA